MFEQLLSILSPLLVCAAIGVGWKQLGYDYPSDFIGRLVMNVGAPCLILYSLAATDIALSQLAEVALVAVLVLTTSLLLSLPLLKFFRLDHHTYLPPLLFPNCGNMALPLSLFAFGETGLALAIGYFLTMMFAHLTVGVLILEGASKSLPAALGNLLRQPILYSMLLGLLISHYDLSLPLWIANPVQLLSGITVPLMLITLGVSLTSLRVEFWRRAVLLSLFKLTLSLSVALLACHWLAITGVTRAVILIQASMPAAVFNYLFAVRYRQQPEEVAGIVVVSTLISALLLPFLFALLLTTPG